MWPAACGHITPLLRVDSPRTFLLYLFCAAATQSPHLPTATAISGHLVIAVVVRTTRYPSALRYGVKQLLAVAICPSLRSSLRRPRILFRRLSLGHSNAPDGQARPPKAQTGGCAANDFCCLDTCWSRRIEEFLKY